MELIGMLAIALFKLNTILRSHSNSAPLSDLDGLQSRTQQQLCHILITAGFIAAAVHISSASIPVNHPPLDVATDSLAIYHTNQNT